MIALLLAGGLIQVVVTWNEPKLSSSDASERLEALGAVALTNQRVFAGLALTDAAPDVRCVAAQKVTDQSILAKVALNDDDQGVRAAATYQLKDQAALAEVATEDRVPDLRLIAVVNLTNQAILAKLAIGAWDRAVARAAVAKLSDPVFLAKVAIENSNLWSEATKGMQVSKLTDQPLLARFALMASNPSDRQAAVVNLTNQAILATVASEADNRDIAQAAVAKISDQAALTEVASRAKNPSIAQAAAAKLSDQTSLVKVGLFARYDPVRREALRKIDRARLRASVAARGSEWEAELTRVAAMLLQATDESVPEEHRLDVESDAGFGVVSAFVEPAWRSELGDLTSLEIVWTSIMQTYTGSPIEGEVITFVLGFSKHPGVLRATWSSHFPQEADARQQWQAADVAEGLSKILAEIANPALERQLALSAATSSVRLAAVHNLTDENLLGKIAAEDEDYNVRRAAALRKADGDLKKPR